MLIWSVGALFTLGLNFENSIWLEAVKNSNTPIRLQIMMGLIIIAIWPIILGWNAKYLRKIDEN